MRFSVLLSATLLAGSLPVWAQSADQVIGTRTTQEASQGAGDKVLSTAALEPAKAQAIRQHFEARFPGIQVTLVRASPLAGIYEVQVGMDLLYTDANADYVLQGSLIDARARKDLTAERVEVLQQVAFDSLPLDKAIKQVKGNGSRQVAVFEDPNCGYCKQLHRTLRDVDDVTVYTFLFPILAPDSTTKSRDIWCASDPARAWKDWMLDGKVPATAQCDTPIQETLALGRKLNVQGTPALFFADGTRVNGALPLDALKKKLDALGS
ncbi:DsbC family protein [Castellaniella sp. GW247-6E4]|uniref:DsbC family protein n=1 Tax=Castellaniella sp. GW247-6E4 TaxID=3140380 RepID=UPI0033156D15